MAQAKPKKPEPKSEIEIIELRRGRLEMCILGTTPLICNRMSQKSARELLQSTIYHADILDIKAHSGIALLDIAVRRKIPALMLTAHGLTADNLVGSI